MSFVFAWCWLPIYIALISEAEKTFKLASGKTPKSFTLLNDNPKSFTLLNDKPQIIYVAKIYEHNRHNENANG